MATAAPALMFGWGVALNAGAVGRTFNVVTKIDRWSRRVAGTLFIVVGVWISLRETWGVW